MCFGNQYFITPEHKKKIDKWKVIKTIETKDKKSGTHCDTSKEEAGAGQCKTLGVICVTNGVENDSQDVDKTENQAVNEKRDD